MVAAPVVATPPSAIVDVTTTWLVLVAVAAAAAVTSSKLDSVVATARVTSGAVRLRRTADAMVVTESIHAPCRPDTPGSCQRSGRRCTRCCCCCCCSSWKASPRGSCWIKR
uniref:Putative secreted protein n=1 Tax=Anopheles darlingi TaxID=43151 RepID=A0A2M4DCU7_ANODA